MILLWIFAAVAGLALLGTIARTVAAVLTVSVAAAGALLITALTSSAFDLEPSRDTGAVIGLFVFSLAAILALCHSGARRRVQMAAGPAAKPPQRAASRVSIGLDRVSLRAPSARGHPRREVVSGTTDAADLRRLSKTRRAPFWHGKARTAHSAARRLAIAWEILEVRAGDHSARIAVAKRSCERLLALEQDGLRSNSALDAVTTVRKGMPELVETWLIHAVMADAGERRQAFAEMIACIERVAARAERETETLTHSNAAAFAFQRDHLDRRSGDDQL